MEGISNSPIQWLHFPARNVRSLIPALRQWKQRFIPDFPIPPRPVLLHLLLGLEASHAFAHQISHRRLDPIGLDLDTARTVAERRRRLGPVQEEHVGEVRDGDAQGGAGAALPVLGDGLAVCAADVELREAAGDRVEAGREGDDVELDEPGAGADAVGRDLLDRGGVNVNNIDVWEGGDFVKVLLEGRALCSPWVRGSFRGEQGLFSLGQECER